MSAGRSETLRIARQRRLNAAKALQALDEQAPRLKNTLQDQLKRQFKVDPYACGLKHDERQVTLLTLAARMLASPTFAAPFADWTSWGFPEGSPYATWQAGDWLSGLVPVWAGTGIRAWTDYWSGRMPGQAISRQAHAAQLLREHFAASLDLAFGLDQIDAAAWRQGQPSPTTEYALARWVHPNGKAETCIAALLVKPWPGETRWLLYRPDADSVIETFADHDTLRTWLHSNRYILWPAPAAPLVPGSSESAIDWMDITADGFASWVEEALDDTQRSISNHLIQAAQESETDPLDWTALQAWEEKQAIAPRPALPPTSEQTIDTLIAHDQQLATEELHFDALPQQLPLGWRKQRIARQEQFLATYLGDDTLPSSNKMARLREHQAQLEAIEAEFERLFSQLPTTITATTWGERHAETSRFDHLSQLRARALCSEARLQHLLGELKDEHLAWVEALEARPKPSLQRKVQPYALRIKLGSRSWRLTNLLALQGLPDADTLEPDRSWLLYKAGRDGGLMHLASQAQLAERVRATLYGAWPESLVQSAWPQGAQALLDALYDQPQAFELVCEPITTDAFDYCTQTLLASLPQAPSLDTVVSRLGLAVNLARSHAFARLAERNRTDLISARLQHLKRLPPDARVELAAQVEALRKAMLTSNQLLERDLPERGQFVRSALEQKLRADFGMETTALIKLDIADHFRRLREPLGESGVGHAFKEVIVFSTSRSLIDLADFLLWALDDDLKLRLTNANVVFAEGPVEPKVREGVNLSYIANVMKTLDLAQAYEDRIIDTFKGLPGESMFESERRKEALRTPFAHQLKIIALSQPDTLDETGQRMLERFCLEQENPSEPCTIDFHTVLLRPGTAADGTSDAVTLAGIFLLQAATGPTLLLVPDAPDGKSISQYATPALACRALEHRALTDSMSRYLAKLPLDGAEAEHLAYIDTALSRNFSGFIGPGIALSGQLAAYRATLLMGRLIHQNRATSRSQVDLYLETEAIRHGRVYDYIKIALGFVPVVGTAIALYDGWHAATDSVEAFLRGDSASGIEHLNSVFLSLFDAIMDLTPAVAHPAVPRPTARLRTRQRQLTSATLNGHHRYSTSFSGYEAEVPTGRWAAHAGAHGAGIHHHVGSQTDYIIRNGRYYQVEWDATHLTWRLKATATRTYKQPIRLGTTGVWETHGSLSGHLVDSGLAGGGGYVSSLYDRSLTSLRRALGLQPRQLTPLDILQDIHTNRQAHRAQLSSKVDALNSATGMGPDGPVRPAASAAEISRARNDVVSQLRSYLDFHQQSLERLRSLRAEIGRTGARNIIEEFAFDMGRQHPNLIQQLHIRMLAHFERLAPLEAAITTLDPARLTAHVKELQHAYGQLADALRDIEQELQRIGKMRNQLQKKNLTDYLEKLDKLDIPLNPNGYRMVRLSALGTTLLNPNATFDLVFWRQFNDELAALRNALYSHGDLPLTPLSQRNEHRFLTQLQQQYQRFDTRMRIWEDAYPNQVQANAIGTMRTELSRLLTETEQSLATIAPRPVARRPNRGPRQPILFETEDQRLYIGRENTVAGQQQMQIANGATNEPHATFGRTPQGQWQRTPPAPQGYNASLQQLQSAARNHLAKVPEAEAALQRYKAQKMLPRDLEDYAQGCASPLRELATSIERQAGQAITDASRSTVNQLRQAAAQLDALGRRLRIEQTKATNNPTVAHLEYLNAEGQVTLEWSRVLEPAKNRQGHPIEYLEEYRIIDNATNAALWYAHFHFKKKPRQQFSRLEAGHLKLASERNQGAGAWRGPMTEAQATSLFDGLRPNQP
ncbi:hypothetical protein ACNFG0_13415 [Pseudomonas sp. NY15372]|uniref:hypothetical protein n=1 Tax=Pseudomonas sp. NY15372 TaxID=3400356 RepID=UPI003A83E16C